jgi:carbamate kinase
MNKKSSTFIFYEIQFFSMKIAVVALGGNAVITPKEKGTVEQQIKHIKGTVSHMRSLFRKYNVIITYGNGPQVGNLLIQQKIAKDKVPEKPLDVCGAMTQGQLGYFIHRALENVLGIKSIAIITQVLVDKKDRAFKNATKPIGPYYSKKIEKNMIKEPEGYRKIVPSPLPKKIIEINEIKALVNKGYTVIASGGGGIPVIKEKGKLKGVEAVIDKDYSAERLATQLKASLLVILTDVKYVYLNYGKENQKPIKKMNIKEAKKYLKQGQFKEGSMKPKIKASVNFIQKGGKKVIITTPSQLNNTLKGKTGTVIE